MKTKFIIALLALISTTSFAQKPGFSWNIKGGINISNWSKGSDTKARIGYKVGGGAECAFNHIWSIQSSMFLASKGTKIENSMQVIKVNQVYIEMPVMGAARFNVANNTNIVLSAGPYIAYGIAGKTKSQIRGTATIKENTFGDYGVKRFDMGLGIGTAVELGRFIIGLDGQYGLTKVIHFSGDSPKNINLSILAGFKF